MHLFNTREYEEYEHRTFLYTKKNLEAAIEMEAQKLQAPIESDSEELYDCQAPSGDLLVYYKGATTPLPNVLLTNMDFKQMLQFAYQ